MEEIPNGNIVGKVGAHDGRYREGFRTVTGGVWRRFQTGTLWVKEGHSRGGGTIMDREGYSKAVGGVQKREGRTTVRLWEG